MGGNLYYVFGILLFLAVVLFIEGAYVWWNDAKGPEAKRIESRLRVMSAGRHEDKAHLSILKERMLADSPVMQKVLLQLPRIHQLDRLLQQSGLTLSAAQFLSLVAMLGVGAGIGALLLGWPLPLVVLAAALAAAVPWMVAYSRKRERLAKIDLQMPDALDLMGRALRAGHALPGALEMVGDEMADPIASEFRITFDEVNYGIAMKDALANLAARVPIDDLRFFVIAVQIQRETGGNLAELLDNLASLIRARHKLMGTIRVLSAEGRLSATILCILPFVVAVVIYLLNPKFIATLWTDPFGVRLLVAGAIGLVIGIIWTQRIIRIRV
jgi:tight adherence protein B